MAVEFGFVYVNLLLFVTRAQKNANERRSKKKNDKKEGRKNPHSILA